MAGMNLEETEDMARFILDINEEKGVTIVLIEIKIRLWRHLHFFQSMSPETVFHC